MRLVDRKTFDDAARGTNQRASDAEGRWRYYWAVADLLKGFNAKRVLEVGPGICPVVLDADTLDKTDRHGWPVTHLMDACRIPWPIRSNAYDLVIGLQCLEHMIGMENAVFREMVRVASRRVIISLPYMWPDGPDENHKGIDDKRIAQWTYPLKPTRIVDVSSHEAKRRIIHDFDIDKYKQGAATT